MITDPLSKRKAGTPLSEAERAQRVAAANARWAKRRQPKLTMLIGPPASGKSTWRAANLPDAHLISTDAVLERARLPVTPENIDAATKIARRDFQEAVAANKDIVIDRTNPTVKSRARWLSRLPVHYRKEAVLFETHGLERAHRVASRNEAGVGVNHRFLRFVVPTEHPIEGEFDHVEVVRQGLTPAAIAWKRMAKRAPGKPLSEAEHEQRVNAARSRWKDLAATGTGAAIAGGVTAATLGYAGRRQRAAIVSSHAPVLAAQAQTEARLNRHGNKEAQVNRGLSPRRRTFNENALKTLGSQVRQGEVAHRAILDSAKPELGQFNHDTNQVEPTWSEHQAREMQGLQARTQATQARIDDIRANGRPDRRVQVQAGRGAQVQPHERIVPENHVVWDRGAHERLAGLRQRFGHGETAQPEAGTLRPARPADLAANQRIIDGLGNLRQGHNQHWLPQPHEARQVYSQLNTLDDLERMVRGMAGRARSAFLDRFGLPGFRRPQRGRGRAVPVAGGQRRGAQAHTRQVEGYPNFAARRQLAGELRHDVADRAWAWRGAEAKRGAWRTALAGLEARAAAFPHQQALRVLEHPGTRLAALGAAAVAGGIGAHLLAQHIWGQRELGKSADEQLDPDYFDQASAVEAKLARNLASALGNWKDSVADGAGMSGKMTADLTEALAPLGEAIQAGASAPMTLSGDPNGSRRLAFTLAARSPAPADFIDAYRLDRVRELQQDQVDAVKSVLAAAARDGAAPAEMARRIRQTVGLTTNQASQVLNYRRDLERLDPNALQRSLRDQRFDSTVSTAIAKQTALPAAKIDQAVDAYHRRYLALRSTTIARTEALRAANNGHAAAMTELLNDQPGATVVKTWVATHDGRTRDSHRKLDGKSVVGMDTPFVCDDGSELLWPHDPDGPADQVINCRCTFVTHLIPAQVQAPQETEDA